VAVFVGFLNLAIMSSAPMDLGPANPRVSPLIKLSRWTLFVGGIFWGIHRYNVNKRNEDEIRAYNARMKPVWDAEKAMKAAKENREGMIYLAKETGTPVSTTTTLDDSPDVAP
jgi:hypothetical protein